MVTYSTMNKLKTFLRPQSKLSTDFRVHPKENTNWNIKLIIISSTRKKNKATQLHVCPLTHIFITAFLPLFWIYHTLLTCVFRGADTPSTWAGTQLSSRVPFFYPQSHEGLPFSPSALDFYAAIHKKYRVQKVAFQIYFRSWGLAKYHILSKC